MKNIMFLVDGNEYWIGGVYYVKNIIYSLLQNEKTEETFKIYIYINKKFKSIFEVFSKYRNIEFIEFENKIQRIKLLNECLERNINSIYPITNNAFNVLGDICINWIPDFQHVFLPEMFSEKEIKSRNEQFLYFAKESKRIVLSSNDARNTFEKLYYEYKDKVVVMPFISYIEEEVKGLNDDFTKLVLEKYKLNDEFIYLPNQFWKHKNHIVVFEAMNHLVNELKLNIQLVCTGNKNDYRNAEYFNELQEYINKHKLNENIEILGLVSREEQLAIMKTSKLIIQPSLFEGWGTVLEEAKFFNKRVLLSDIPVHFEQRSKKSIIFNRNSYIDLADKILKYFTEDINHSTESVTKELQQNVSKYSQIAYDLFNNYENHGIDLKLINQYKKKLRNLFLNSEGKNIAVYGTGEHTMNMIYAYKLLIGDNKFNIVYLDSNKNKKGQKFLGSTIYHKDDILSLGISRIIISSYEFQNEIYNDIKKYKIHGIEIVKIYDEQEKILFI